jgi:hypothetical protein
MTDSENDIQDYLEKALLDCDSAKINWNASALATGAFQVGSQCPGGCWAKVGRGMAMAREAVAAAVTPRPPANTERMERHEVTGVKFCMEGKGRGSCEMACSWPDERDQPPGDEGAG